MFIAGLLGVRHVLVVVNKMDLAGYDRETYRRDKTGFLGFASKLNIRDLQFIPVSATEGDMVVNRGDNLGLVYGDDRYWIIWIISKYRRPEPDRFQVSGPGRLQVPGLEGICRPGRRRDDKGGGADQDSAFGPGIP